MDKSHLREVFYVRVDLQSTRMRSLKSIENMAQ